MTWLYPSKTGPVFHYPDVPGPYLGAVFFELFLYGIYMTLFSSYAAILLHKKRIHWVPLVSVTTMFVIASADIGYTVNLVFRKLLEKGLEYEDLRPKYILYVVNSAIADMLLIYKFYLIWSSKKWMLVGPIFLLTAATGCGFTFEGTTVNLSQLSWINLSFTVVLNVIVTSLTAGRILYVGRYARAMLGDGVPRALAICAAVMVESGFLYTIYALLDLAFRTNPTMNIILDGGLIQVVGITPTLILVQIALGRASTIGEPSTNTPQQGTEETSSYWSEETRRMQVFTSHIPLSDFTPRFTSDEFQAV